MPQASSIDNFIDSHRHDPRLADCGKLAIARCILEAEASSLLAIDRRNIFNKMNFAGAARTWFSAFFQLVAENCNAEQFAERLKSVGVICFNYDRCFEHYMFHSIQNYYGLTAGQADEILSGLEIYHPYGMVGKLPLKAGEVGTEYGARPSARQLVEIAGLLRTFTEGTDPTKSDIESIRKTIQSARRIALLGFAFHRLNLELLIFGNPPLAPTNGPLVFGTAISLSHSDCEAIRAELINGTSGAVKDVTLRNDLTCAQLFTEYRRRLSLN
jgi:hypothetical protein